MSDIVYIASLHYLTEVLRNIICAMWWRNACRVVTWTDGCFEMLWPFARGN